MIIVPRDTAKTSVSSIVSRYKANAITILQTFLSHSASKTSGLKKIFNPFNNFGRSY